jgi:hypothetical protein
MSSGEAVMTYVSYVDVAVLSGLFLTGTALTLFASRFCFRVGWYICKWATAWAIVTALVASLDSFPAYSAVKNALFDTVLNAYDSSGGEQAVRTVWQILRQRLDIERENYADGSSI